MDVGQRDGLITVAWGWCGVPRGPLPGFFSGERRERVPLSSGSPTIRVQPGLGRCILLSSEVAVRLPTGWMEQVDVFWRNPRAARRSLEPASEEERVWFTQQFEAGASSLRRHTRYLIGTEPPGFEQTGSGTFREGRCAWGWEYVEVWAREADVMQLAPPAAPPRGRSERGKEIERALLDLIHRDALPSYGRPVAVARWLSRNHTKWVFVDEGGVRDLRRDGEPENWEAFSRLVRDVHSDLEGKRTDE